MPVPFDPYAMQGRDSAPICFFSLMLTSLTRYGPSMEAKEA